MIFDQSYSDAYQDFPTSHFRSKFWDFYKVIWEAERRFDLVFRRDHNVAVWTANRVRFYYLIAEKLGLYDSQMSVNSGPIQVTLEDQFAPIAPVNHIIQTGANGPATDLRKRPRGCVYTSEIVDRLLNAGSSLLLIHGAPEDLDPHPKMQAMSFDDFNRRVRQNLLKEKQKSIKLDPEAIEFWDSVSAYFHDELGIEVFDSEGIRRRIQSHRRQYAAHREFLRPLQANSLVCMAHYFRSPLIEAAKNLKLWTVDYQHGINSRYHLGYGYPNVRPEHRNIPYMPDEFWSWGKVWTDESWFPTECCAPRQLGHHQEKRNAETPVSFLERPEKTILIATSWAMQSQFRSIAKQLADKYPDWTIRLKLHPREDASSYASVLADSKNLELIRKDVDIRDAAAKVRYVLSICSSSLFDVLLEDCKIAVLNAPAIEYAEDFATRFDVPVLNSDAANFADVIRAMRDQDIPKRDVFHVVTEEEWDLLTDSLSTPIDSVRLEKLVNDDKNLPFMDRKRLQYYKQHCDHKVQPELLLMPNKGGVLQRFSAKAVRRRKQQTYFNAIRNGLDSLGSLDMRATALETAIVSGLEPARFVGPLREIVQNASQAGNSAALHKITGVIRADTSAQNAPLSAEMFEHFLATRTGSEVPDRRANETHWTEAISLLRDLSPVTNRLAKSYEKFATLANQCFADTRVSQAERSRLKSELSNRIKSGDNFTMLRLGDGEVYAFSPDWVSKEAIIADQELRESMWWEQTIASDIREDLQQQARKGITAADYLGIPSAYRLLRDIPKLLLKMRGPIETWPRTARAHRILFEELERMVASNELDWSQKALIDDRCHQELFLPQYLSDFAAPGRPAVLVNCFPMDEVNRVLGNRFFSHEIRLPPHKKVRHLVPEDALSAIATPLLMEDILDQVNNLAQDGAIFFVAGGFPGKAIINRIAKLGATALDIGASADYWMGATTRGPLDFKQYGKPA